MTWTTENDPLDDFARAMILNPDTYEHHEKAAEFRRNQGPLEPPI